MNDNYTKKCPECEETLNKAARACTCGWKNYTKKAVSAMKQCGYSNNGIQCPRAATVDDATCGHHYQWWDSPRIASINLDDILSGKLPLKKERWSDIKIRELQEKHPEFAVVPSSREEVKDLIEMTKKFMRRTRELPYDKTKRGA